MNGRMRGTKHISSNNRNGREFIFIYVRYLLEDTSNAMNFLRTQIVTLKKRYLKNLVIFFQNYFKNIQWYHVALDSIELKIYKPNPPKITRKSPRKYFSCYL